jgi:hypothetical protein
MGIQIIHHQDDLLRQGKIFVYQLFLIEIISD